MRLVARLQSEERGHVFLEVRRLRDGVAERLVESLVVLEVISRKLLLREVNLEEFFFTLLVTAILRRLLERGIGELGRRGGGAAHVNLFARRDDVALVHALRRHAIHTVRTGDEQQPRLELLQEHHALTLEVSSEKDQHLTGRDGRAKLGLLVLDRALQRLFDVIGGVEARLPVLHLFLRLSHGHVSLDDLLPEIMLFP